MPPINGTQKSPSKPVRQIQKKVTLTSQEVSDLLAEGVSNGPPSAIRAESSSTKRKPASEFQADSEVEILDCPLPTQKKRRKVPGANASSTSALPPLSSPIALPIEHFKSVPTSTPLLAALDAALSPTTDHHHDDPAVENNLSPSGRPIRARTKTEKANQSPAKRPQPHLRARARPTPSKKNTSVKVDLSADIVEQPPVQVDKPAPAIDTIKPVKKSLEQVSAEAAAALENWNAGRRLLSPMVEEREASASPPATPALRPIPSDDSLPDVSNIFMPVSSPRRRATKPQLPASDSEEEPSEAIHVPSLKAVKGNPYIDDEAVESDAEGSIEASEGGAGSGVDDADHCDSDSDDHEDSAVADVDHVTSGSVVPAAVDSHSVANSVVDPDAVMQPDLWHPVLAPTYGDLTFMEKLAVVEPFTNGPNGTPSSTMRVNIEDMAAAMGKKNVRCLTAGLLFVSSGIYANTARIDPDRLIVESSRLKWVDTRKPAICVMVGLVTECALISAAAAGSQRNPYNTHRISIAPAYQEIRRDMSAWGQLFGFTSIKGPSSELGIGFSTYGEGKAPGFGFPASPSAPSTPKKPASKYAVSVKSPLVSKASAGSLGQPIRFEDRVPIYDGRDGEGKPFTFSDADFKALQDWPRYENNEKDVPLDSIVAVGYTLGTYLSSSGSNARFLSTNISFVVVLSTPKTEVG